MSISPSDHNLAMLQLDQNNAVQKKMDMDGLKKRLDAAPNKAAKLREACEGFESVFIQKLWEQMRKNVQKEGYLHSRDEQMYQGMYDTEFSKKLTQAGGIGLADMLYEQLSQRLGESSRTTSTKNDPRLPILPADSSVSGLGMTDNPIRELDYARSQAGLPLNNRQIKPLYEDATAFQAPIAKSGEPDELSDLAPFDDEAMEEQTGEMENRQLGSADELDFEAVSHGLLQDELEADAQGVAVSPEATSVSGAAAVKMSATEKAIIEAALRQNMADAGRITAAQAPVTSQRGASYAQIENVMKAAIEENGTDFAREVAKSAETAAINTKNHLPRS